MIYYISLTTSNPGNNNEVHREDCRHLPLPSNRKILGSFTNGNSAVNFAKSNGYPNADGCYYCCKEAHKG